MADTVVPTALQVEAWENKFNLDYIQGDIFTPLYGTEENAVIQVKEEYGGKSAGDTLTIQLVNQLTNAATTGTNVLEGNEEDLTQRSHSITVNKRRHAVRVPEMSKVQSAIDLLSAGRATLMQWAKSDTRDLFIDALTSLNGTNFTSRTSTIADAWLVDNADRTVFGAYAKGGSAGGTDMSADLGQLDTSSDLFTSDRLEDMLYVAKTCSPKVRPVEDQGNGRRYYIALCHPAAFRDLRASIDDEWATTTVGKEAMKLFQGGDILWDNCIVKEVDDYPIWANIGNSSAEVTPVHLLGAQALGIGFAKRWTRKSKSFDYDDKEGVAIESIYGVSKLRFGTGTTDTDDQKDHGVVSGFFATTAAATVASAGEV
jgi:N4-gp56 family major capsid protein